MISQRDLRKGTLSVFPFFYLRLYVNARFSPDQIVFCMTMKPLFLTKTVLFLTAVLAVPPNIAGKLEIGETTVALRNSCRLNLLSLRPLRLCGRKFPAKTQRPQRGKKTTRIGPDPHDFLFDTQCKNV